MKGSLKSYSSMTDEILRDKIIAGDKKSIEFLLIECCGKKFKQLCAMYPHAGFEWMDLTQEVFQKLMDNDWHVLRFFRGRGKNGVACRLSTYVITIAARLIKRKNIKGMSEINWSHALIDKDGNAIDIEDSEISEQQNLEMLRQDVIKMIMQLEDPKERLVLIEYKIRDRSIDDVASMLGTSTVNIYTICSRAIKKLGPIMEKGGLHA